jgi:hypothetical protein
MCLHRKRRAIDQVLAGTVEVQLQQAVAIRAYGDAAGPAEVQLDGVPVIDNGIGRLVPGDAEIRQFAMDHGADVEWRLLGADCASPGGCIELVPVVRSGLAGIAPVRAF